MRIEDLVRCSLVSDRYGLNKVGFWVDSHDTDAETDKLDPLVLLGPSLNETTDEGADTKTNGKADDN